MIEVSGDIIYHNGTAVGFITVREGTRRERFLEELQDGDGPVTFEKIKRQLEALHRLVDNQINLEI